MTTTPPGVETEQSTRPIQDLLPRYAVILLNDDVNSMDHVVRALLKSVPELSEEEAIRVMLEAHNNGSAVVIVCPLEHAELYRDRIRSFAIGCTIERV